ncbi:hypothetical protein [Frankia sp. EAN1pec]|uniref:P-loop NTPase n=1 Tax=Parafrankia sp. (strain EAN1pec) TaxID=298653 RepID=UPI0002D6B124
MPLDPSPSPNLSTASDLEMVGRSLIEGRLPSSSILTLVKPLVGGHTDALVFLCDIAGNQTAEELNGQFILKIGRAEHSQGIAHQEFCQNLGEFGIDHVPRHLMGVLDIGVSVDLYDVAGFSLDSVRTAEQLDHEDLVKVCFRVASELLPAQLPTGRSPQYTETVGQVFHRWLGSNFPANRRGKSLRQLARRIGVTGRTFRFDGELLPNPLSVLERNSTLERTKIPYFRGYAHGDLHLRNVLVGGSIYTRNLSYWLIDVSWDEPSPLLFDQAYLELSVLLHTLPNAGSGRVLGLLSKIDNEHLTVPARLSSTDSAIVDLIEGIRSTTIEKLEEQQPRRRDVWRQQYVLSRIAAGLNWAAKPLGDIALQRAAFIAAAWATRGLLRDFDDYNSLWNDLARDDLQTQTGFAPLGEPVLAAEAIERWTPFSALDTGSDLFLIADRTSADEQLNSFAACQWAAVMDLNPESDETGLARAILPSLRSRRHVSMFGENRQLTSPGESTNWLMANGWRSRNEPTASSDAEWRRRGYRPRVRQLVDDIVVGTPNRGAAVLCLRSGDNDMLIDYILDYIDEKYDGIAARLDLATTPGAEGLDLDVFLAAVATSLPIASIGREASIPGADGPFRLDRADLHRLSVDLEVLHSHVLAEGQATIRETDAFWRGRPPTWADLEAWIDVQRDAYPDLLGELRDRLEDRQLACVEFEHSPGAGGTTLARRVAWNLHRIHPVVLLRNYTPTTVERVNELYQDAGRPPLVVAESADLPESDRDELLHDLQQRNSRAVVLWVNRTNAQRNLRHQLIDPVSGSERQRFITEYLRRATTPKARRLLGEIAESDSASLPAQRLSPFYFGLCVYESQFEGVEPYVQYHMAKLAGTHLKIAGYLALVTRYAQVGIPIDLVRRWLAESPPQAGGYGDKELRALLGPDLRNLVVSERHGLRLLHPLLAEHVLAGDPSRPRFGLAQISVELIRKTTEYLGPENQATRRLLEDLFVRRKGWSEGRQRPDLFSELVQDMPTDAAEWVFEELTTRCPKEPHFWNHRGRYHIYRVRGDFGRAEGFLLRAVEESYGRNSTHLHTLGMVRRIWIENEMEELAKSRMQVRPEQILEHFRPLFDSAMDAFARGRDDPNSAHSWVTPIQLIATVVEYLVKFSGARNLVEFLEGRYQTSNWVGQQLAQAEVLLDGLRSNFADDRRQAKYYAELAERFDLLYGDLNALVEQWRNLRHAINGRAAGLGVAIARTLYAHAGRDLSRLSEDETREIVSMVEGLVESGEATDADLRLWYQAYRRLPEYSETRSLERFSWYASTRGSFGFKLLSVCNAFLEMVPW